MTAAEQGPPVSPDAAKPAASVPSGTPDHSGSSRVGLAYGAAAYLLWGFFPFYFYVLTPAGPWEILGHRIVWTFVFCVLVLLWRRDLGWVRPILSRRRLLAGLAVAACLLSVNWVVYVAAVVSGHTSDAALGYFLNPLLTVALGVVVLGERLRPLQWVAVGIGAFAAVFLTVVAGQLPIIALTLAVTFALYGLTKNRVGATLPALHGLTVETTVLVPVALLLLGPLSPVVGSTFTTEGVGHAMLLVLGGAVTAIPLVLFAAAARRLPLVTIGLLQFLAPVMQLLSGVVLGERITPARWVGFGIVWVALVILTIDSVRHRPGGARATAVG